MNTTRSTTAKVLETIGNAAAYIFWISSALIGIGFFAILFTYDTPAAYQVGQIFAAVGFLMFASILTMKICVGKLKRRGEY